MSTQGHISWDDRAYDAPIIQGSESDIAVDVSRLRAKTGLVTYDEGFANTAVTRSAITYIDGDQGILRYRGYPIEQLAAHADFLETAYLLIYGELPTREQLDQFRHGVTRHTLLHEDLRPFFDAFRDDAHPMGILTSAAAALSTYYQGHDDPFNAEDVEISTLRLLAKMPTVAAFAYKRSIGQPYVYPLNRLGYAENFLNMMFAVPSEPYEVDEDMAHALNLLLVLHADHEQNCSTATVRLVGSAHTNLFASISAGISALWGPLHGGASQGVVEMLTQITDGGMGVEGALKRAKDRDDPFRLMGFGHRVYKNFDPRAQVIKQAVDKLLAGIGRRDALLDVAVELEEAALNDEYFVERKLYPNVDFYSGLIYRAMGLPLNMFPALFALGRLPGWIAQWRELINDPDRRLGRPRQVYVGPTARDYVPLERRG